VETYKPYHHPTSQHLVGFHLEIHLENPNGKPSEEGLWLGGGGVWLPLILGGEL
jgi:hypothetical protein